MDTSVADVALILEGTYPYVAGGVSTWVHQILQAYPARQFALLHIGAHPGAYGPPLYELPANVTAMHELHCRGREQPGRPGAPRIAAPRARRAPSRVLGALCRMHTGAAIDDRLLADLAAGDLTIHEFLHGDATFELLYRQLYDELAPEAAFMDFFWHMRAMHIPLLRLLAAPCPPARVYHAVSTGYAGLVGAIASWKTGRPLVVTEHGLYARERQLELARATWITDLDLHGHGSARPSPLRELWAQYFQVLSRIAYHQATCLVTLSEANRAKQLIDGADPAKIIVVPNGVAGADLTATAAPPRVRAEPARLRLGFVGRVVPIKDVITLLRAVALAREEVDLELWIIGPETEDPAYARRCHELVDALGLAGEVRFLGPQAMAPLYPQLDVLVLTSLSEGQPLVILEAYAEGVPVIATDVGACRELIEGGGERDRALGPSGIVTRVANPVATAAAICALARQPELRAQMAQAARARVRARYRLTQVVASYERLYAGMAA
ncbi:MAG: GT4 family glycosyltransferase PelF [Myxococcales bacterium]|nr:GT4 family glycosyltransferase PelF [Myxococcales bacterium]